MKSCKSCKYNRKRTIKNKSCLKEHRALYGFKCYDYEPKEINKYDIGYQITIFDILEEVYNTVDDTLNKI